METNRSQTSSQSQCAITGKELRTSVILGFIFFFLFTSYGALQNLQGSLNDEEGLGVISLGCLYAAAILSAIYAPLWISLIGPKWTVMAACCGHLVYVSSNFFASFYTLIPASIVLGAVTGPLWTSGGLYLTSCALSLSESTQTDLYSALTKVNGVFVAMFELSGIVGNLLSSLVLYQDQYNTTDWNTSLMCGSSDCPSIESSNVIDDPEPTVVYILLGIFLTCVAVGLSISWMFLPNIQNPQANTNVTVLSLFTFVWRSDMKYLLPIMLYIAIEQTVIFTEITKAYVSCPIGIQNVGYVMTAYGVSSTICAFSLSQVAKYIPRYVFITCAGLLQMALMIWMYLWAPGSKDTVKIFLLSGLWGVSEGVWKTQANVVLGDMFSDDKQPAFAVYEGTKSIGFTVTFLYSPVLCVRTKLIIALSVLTFGMLLYWVTEVKFSGRIKSRSAVEPVTADKS